ncbi:hypothetical protein B0H11DRAFT_1030829 [Mycena galericulata]|nr:hypothetical protein B0H11DRAFT_1030829 [Mycena galericulata]
MLHEVRSFSFEARAQNFHWCELPEELRRAICGLCHRASLISLELAFLGTFADPTEFSSLLASPTLTELTLALISVPALPLSSDREGPSSGPLAQNKCEFDLPRMTLDKLIPWLDERESFSQLQHLFFVWVPDTTSHLQRILSASMSTVEELTLTLPDDPTNYAATHLCLANLPNLRLLELTLVLGLTSSETTVPWLAGLVSSHQNPGTLTDLVLKVYLLTFQDLLVSVATIDWEPLGSVLTRFPISDACGCSTGNHLYVSRL